MKRSIFIVFAVFLVLVQNLIFASAVGYSNYDTECFTGKEYQEYLDRVQEIELVNVQEETRLIESFAISENGLIALAFNGEHAQIDVYTPDGHFLYGYRFINKNIAFAVFFEGENLAIYRSRKGHIASFDSKGNCIQFQKVIYTQRSSDAFHADRYRPSTGTIGNLNYRAEGGFFSNYSRFVIENEEGESVVIYDVTDQQRITIFVTTSLVLCITAIVLYARYKSRKEQIDDAESNDSRNIE